MEEVKPTDTTVTDTDNSGVETPSVEPKETDTTKVQEPKTFTQAEVDKIVQERVARMKKPNPSAEEKIKVLEARIANYEQDNLVKGYKSPDDKKIDARFVEFVKFKVSQGVSEQKDFNTALNEFMEGDGKEYLEPVSKPTIAPTPRPDNSTGKPLDSYAVYVKEKYGKTINNN